MCIASCVAGGVAIDAVYCFGVVCVDSVIVEGGVAVVVTVVGVDVYDVYAVVYTTVNMCYDCVGVVVAVAVVDGSV